MAENIEPDQTEDNPDGVEPLEAISRHSIDAQIAEAMEYRPSEGGTVLARIYDSEFRVPWKAVSAEKEALKIVESQSTPGMSEAQLAELAAWGAASWTTDADLARGEKLLSLILDAFDSGDRATLDRVEAATKVLRGDPKIDPKSDREILVRYIHAIERIVFLADRMHREVAAAAESACRVHGVMTSDKTGRESVRQFYWLMRNSLAEWNSPAFGNLSPERLREAISAVEPDEATRAGGGMRTGGAFQCAAELAVEVGAFGSAGKLRHDLNVTKLRSKLELARTRFNAKKRSNLTSKSRSQKK